MAQDLSDQEFSKGEALRIEAHLPYHGGLLGAHMHDPSATRPSEVGSMIGNWLGTLLSRPAHQIRLSEATNAEVDLVPAAKGQGS